MTPPAATLAATNGLPDISVVIPSWNSARTIGRCLDALRAQQTTLAYEVLVVDSGTDDTAALVAAYAAREGPRVQLLRSATRLFPGPARNLGIRQARAPLIAFTDTDCAPEPGWLEALHRASRAGSGGAHQAVGGRILNGTPESLCGTALYLTEFVEFAGTGVRRYASIPSCNLAWPRPLLDQHGGFPAVFWGEEYLLNTRLPGQILFVPDMVVRHVNRTGFAETVRHAEKVGRGAALSRRLTGQHGVLFRWPVLIPLLFGFRLLKIAQKSAAAGVFGTFLWASPMVLLDLAAWTLGFWRGARDQEHGGG